MAFSEPLDKFFGQFSESITFKGNTIQAFFDNQYQDALGVSGLNPRITAKATDLPNVKRGDPFVIRGIGYKVSQQPKPDGFGMIECELEKT